ncbi:hypothetical protein O6H91_13G002200 [Diphasiastrum complanatum]|uniref:Uncharacterized protein n=1 Tax=Diphasiastrum complanatum TaxID=34168 RepID=A0ACC2BRR1_DIPCM|nr:hypothetical protein O6H91_13G002200 [Diphasiastrum complanatum]
MDMVGRTTKLSVSGFTGNHPLLPILHPHVSFNIKLSLPIPYTNSLPFTTQLASLVYSAEACSRRAFSRNPVYREVFRNVMTGRFSSAAAWGWKPMAVLSEEGVAKAQAKQVLSHNFGALLANAQGRKSAASKPEICTADELHYVSLPGSSWQLALWRYIPPANVRLLQEIIHCCYYLALAQMQSALTLILVYVSLARYMSTEGFETWILEVRGAGLSKNEGELVGDVSGKARDLADSTHDLVNSEKAVIESYNNLQKSDKSTREFMKSATRLSNMVMQLSRSLRSILDEGQSRILSARLLEQISGLLDDAQLTERFIEIKDRLISLLEESQTPGFTSQILDLRRRLANLLEDAQLSVTPQVTSLQERLSSTFDDFQKFLELIEKYNWDFDNYLEEEVPTAIEYIRQHSQPKDGKLLAVGHSMGGILLYALLASKGRDSRMAGVVTIASALDYGVSNSSLKLLLPLADPAQVLNVPVIPLGTLMTALHPLVSRPPYALAWLGSHVSAGRMMDPSLFQKLVLNNFCTIPVKLLLHLSTVFQPGGLTNRNGTIRYKDSLKDCAVPVLALAADEDLICPPPAVLDTVKALPEDKTVYKLFGGQDERHYGHYDLLGSRQVKEEVFPVIHEFLVKCDELQN